MKNINTYPAKSEEQEIIFDFHLHDFDSLTEHKQVLGEQLIELSIIVSTDDMRAERTQHSVLHIASLLCRDPYRYLLKIWMTFEIASKRWKIKT